MIPRITKMFFVLIPFVLLTTAAVTPDRVSPRGDCKWGLNAFTDIPGYGNAAQSNHTCDHFDPNETSLAMFLFYLHYTEEFGDDNHLVAKYLHNLTVIWTDQIIEMAGAGYRVDGRRSKTNTAFGVTMSHGGLIKVYTRRPVSLTDKKRIWKTSFVHELLHVAINAKNGGQHGDPDHEGSQWEGWTNRHTDFIHKTNMVLRKVDL